VGDRLATIAADPDRTPTLPPDVVADARAAVDAWAEDTELRVAALALPRARRIGAIVRAWARGRYRRFQLPGAIVIDLLAARGVRVDRSG
jgi:hypothetical protein